MLLACEYNDHCCFPIAAENCVNYAESKSDPIDELFGWDCNPVTELLKLKLVEDKTEEKTEEKMEERNRTKEKEEENKEYDSKFFFKCLDSKHPDSKRMMIIQGKPGAGKTTFMRTICRDWEKGVIPEFSNKILVLVTLRDLKADCSIKDILMQSCSDGTCDYLNKCLTHHGEHFVFLLDGLDEHHGSPGKNDIEKILCTRDKLKNATIIVTSRSSALLLKRIPSSVRHTFQIDDINKEQVFQYFAEHEEVKKHLKENPNILQLCYVPLHCAMLKDIFNYSDRPKTETLFFKKHTEFRITRALNYKITDELTVQLDELMHGRDENAILLRRICEFAYNATEKSDNLAFDENSEIVKCCLDANITTSAPKRKGINRLGLLVIYPDTSKAKASRTNLYSFGHLTSQEFLAGCHIAYQLLPMKEPKEIINETTRYHLRNAWKFACGLQLFKAEKQKEIFDSLMEAILQNPQSDQDDLLFMIQCAHETQQKELCEVVYEYLETIELVDITPQDVSVFIKTIEQTSKLPRLKELVWVPLMFVWARLGSNTGGPIIVLCITTMYRIEGDTLWFDHFLAIEYQFAWALGISINYEVFFVQQLRYY